MKHSGVKIKRWLSRALCLRAVDLRCGYLGGAILLAVAVLIRCLSGAPFRVYLLLREGCFLPPLMLLSLINLLMTVIMGFACGLVLSCRRRNVRCAKFQGGMLFVLLAVFWFVTYPLIFRGCLLFAALLSLLVVWILTLGCLFLFFRVHTFSGWIAAAFLFWVTYLIIGLLGCIFFL